MESKVCSKCKVEKLFSEFYIQKSSKTGRRSQCIFCIRSNYETNKDIFLERQSLYRKADPFRIKIQQKNFRENHSEKIKIWKKEYRENNSEKVAAKQRCYYEDNQNKLLEQKRVYYKNNKDAYLAHSAKRRCLQLQAIPPWADEGKIKEFYTQATRLTKNTDIRYSVDHIIPLQGKLVCGLHVETNLRVIPYAENLSKGNRFIEKLLDVPKS